MPGYYASALLFVYVWLFAPWLAAKLVSNGTFFGILSVSGGVFLGLLLYAIDWPAKRAIFKERDKLRQFIIDRAKKCPYGCKLPMEEIEKNAHPLYWFILDSDIPTQRRERIYYFGSVYRVYADIRGITVFAIVAILTTVLAGLLVSCSQRDLVLTELLSIHGIPLATTAILGVVFAVLTWRNKGDRYWIDIIANQLLWLKLHPEVVDNLICKKSMDSDLWNWAQDRAKTLGYTSVSEYILDLINIDEEQTILKKKPE